MATYRDLLVERFGLDIGSVVGCALDRLGRTCSSGEIERAVEFYQAHEAALSTMPIGERRDKVARYIDPAYCAR